MKKLVTGILAHVDSGKTTLSEAMLYRAGEIRRLGRVDHGDAFLDTNEIERDRGITIFSKQAQLSIGDTELTLLDTPGHVDFSTETERTLCVLDYAVLVISGTDGIQNHTETLWELLKRYGVPVFLFINKMDISEKSRAELTQELRLRLSDGCVDFGAEEFFEDAAMCDEALLESYLKSGTLDKTQLKMAISKRKIFPFFFGSALKLDGVDEFLNLLDTYMTEPERGREFGAKVFKISEDERGERLTYIKITGGSLKIKDELCSRPDSRGEWCEKVNQIRIYSGAKYLTAEEAVAGTVCAVTGLSKTYPGEGLGAEENTEENILQPVLSFSVRIEDGTDLNTALKNLRKLEEEEPQLHIIWNERLQEIHVRLMGEVQLEVLRRIIKERFDMDVDFGRGSIAYKETISGAVEGVGHYEPLRHYAEVHLMLEPGKEGSGLKFKTNCSEDSLDRNWQRLIMTHLEEKTHLGVLTGSPITDMTITLTAGRAHKKHTEGGDFRQATYRAVRQGLMTADNVLLEPWYRFSLEVPQEFIGRAMNDIQQMSGEFEPPEISGEMSVLSGTAPVSEMMDYFSEVTGYTSGRGRLSCTIDGYKPCHNADEVIAEMDYDPEADIENTPNSVFCSHGAGFSVKWDEVSEYMHISSGFDAAAAEPVTRNSVSRYVSSLTDDEELMKIFERTYGKIRRDTYNAMDTVKQNKQQENTVKYKGRPFPDGPEYLLIDGYNIIFAWDELREIAEDNLEDARNALIDRICNYRGVSRCEVILVFDAYKVKGSRGEVEDVHNIKVVYTKEAETADSYIEKVSHKLSRKHRVRVATSDGMEQLIILGNGAQRVSAREFKQEIEQAEAAIREYVADTLRS